MSLSFAITTRGPAERVRALLELVRPVADEVVLAVDRRGDLGTLDACADLADRRLTFELDGSASQLIGWVLNQCRAEWILRLDDDEVPSPALLAELPELTRGRASRVGIERRWLWPAPDRYLSGSPWRWEFLPRLLRNVPDAWRFAGRMHDHGDLRGDERLARGPVYHLDLLLATPEARQAKALRYEARRPGLVIEGVPVNTLYVPETLDDVATAAVPAGDLAVVRRVLAGAPAPDGAPARPGPAVEAASPADVAALNWSGPVAGLDAEVALVDPPAVASAATHWRILADVRNRSADWWPAGDDPRAIRLGYRWVDPAGGVAVDQRWLLPEAVAPGGASRVLLWATTPVVPGAYRFELDVVQEGVGWLGRPASARIEVVEDPPARLAGGERAAAARRAELERLERELAAARAELERERAVRGSRAYRAVGAAVRPLDRLRSRLRRSGG